MDEKKLDKMYEIVNNSINSLNENLRHAHNQLIFDKDNEKIKAYIDECELKLKELKKERREILREL